MPHSQDRLTLKRAFGISTALHVMLAPLFVTSAIVAVGTAQSGRGGGASETTRISYLTIDHRAPAIRPARPQKPAAIPATLPRRAARATIDAPAKRPARPTAAAPGSTQPQGARTAGRVALTLATAAPERDERMKAPAAPVEASVRTTATTSPAPAAPASAVPSAVAPSPAPTAASQVADASARGAEAAPGGWGQSFDKPLVADEAALADLRSHYHSGSFVTIEVDEAGHATRVALPSGLSDDVRAELEKRLREMRYVPAECNGLRCGGTLQISI